jgi:hypothetical protein
MNNQFVRVTCNLKCRWEGLAPNYRLYVNNELFAERTYIWQDDEVFLTEEIQIHAPPGTYKLRYELVPPNLAELAVSQPVVAFGPGTIDEQGVLYIPNES